MNPLSAIYAAVTAARNDLYERGALSVRRLQGPVASIGNIAVGGSGKTPFLIALGQLLKSREINFDVLSRGYGRQTKGIAQVDPAGSPRNFGDEPLLIARKLGVPVIVGEDRYLAGQFAERKFGPQLHLLDDGFQHRRLARDFDIVLVNATDAGDDLLPVGRLREPVSALARANAIVLTNETSDRGLLADKQKLWRVRRDIALPHISEPCVAFCGIARPQNFFDQLRAAGTTLAATKTFRDHHAYTGSDVRQLLALQAGSGASAFVTTEKDTINLGPLLTSLGTVHVAEVTMQIEDTDSVLATMQRSFEARNSRRP